MSERCKSSTCDSIQPSYLCITRYAADTAVYGAGDEGLSVYGLKADFSVGLGICISAS